ncbi:MAG: acyl-CoA thioesterase [Roseobacter sp.]
MSLKYHQPLTKAEQAEFGITSPAPLAMADQVRFSELDVLNHVNNAVYIQWFERIRVKYTQINGLARSFGGGQGPRIVIRSASIHYRQEVVLDEDYIVTCACTAFRNTSFSIHQELWAGGTLRATLDCVLVLLQPDGSGRYPIPEALRIRFIENDGAVFEA